MFELLPYKWEWGGISQLYHNISGSAGDVHHFAWRCGACLAGGRGAFWGSGAGHRQRSHCDWPRS